MGETATEPGQGGWGRTVAVGVFIVLCVSLAWSGLMLAFGNARPIEVVSGHSMLPTLRTGDVVVIDAVSPLSLRVGEIVSVHVPKADQVTYHYPPEIVHRIVGLYVRNGALVVQTKGDNEAADPFSVPASAVAGRMLLAIPYVGYGFLFLRSGPGRIALIGLAVLLLLYFGLVSLWGGDDPQEPEPASWDVGKEGVQLAFAIHEYGEHLRSHTRVVQELGATTTELRVAAAMQNAVLASLNETVATLADVERTRHGTAAPAATEPRVAAAMQNAVPASLNETVATPADVDRTRYGPSGAPAAPAGRTYAPAAAPAGPVRPPRRRPGRHRRGAHPPIPAAQGPSPGDQATRRQRRYRRRV